MHPQIIFLPSLFTFVAQNMYGNRVFRSDILTLKYIFFIFIRYIPALANSHN